MIYTDHLVLQPCGEGDINALQELVVDPDVYRCLCDGSDTTFSGAADIVRISIQMDSTLGLGLWTIRRHMNAPLAGFCGFRLIQQASEIELLYALLPRFRGHGLATEACLAALSYLWTTKSFGRVYARADRQNRRSIAVMERLGMCCQETEQESSGGALLTYILDRSGCSY